MGKRNNKIEALNSTESIEYTIGYTFLDKQLLWKALKHISHANAVGNRQEHNERLEFMGDAVLGLVGCDRLYHLPNAWTGFMSNAVLADLGSQLGLGKFIKFGGRQRGDRENSRIVANTLEALVGAVYLDCKCNFYEVCSWFVAQVLKEVNLPLRQKCASNQKAYKQLACIGKAVLHLIATDYLYFRFNPLREKHLSNFREDCKKELIRVSQLETEFLGEMYLNGGFCLLREELTNLLNNKLSKRILSEEMRSGANYEANQ